MHIPIDRRPCCEGSFTSSMFGGCYHHTRKDEKDIQRYENVTQVVNYDTSSATHSITPYPSINNIGLCPCSPDNECGEGHPKCNGWDSASIVTCSGDYSLETVAGFKNCFTKVSGSYIDVSSCHKLGFKNVQMYKDWQGIFGLKYRNGCLPQCCNYESLRPVPTTKYRTITINYTATNIFESTDTGTCGDGVHTETYTYLKSTTVDKYSGIVKLNAFYATDSDSVSPSQPGCDPYINLNTGSNAINPYVLRFYPNACNFDEAGNPTYSQDIYSPCYPVDMTHFHPGAWLGPGYAEGGIDDLQGPFTINEYTDDHYSISFSGQSVDGGGAGPILNGTSSVSFDYEVTLEDPYTASEVYQDLVDMGATWDLSDDKIYPWRSDNFVTVAPMVTYSETHGNILGVPDPDSNDWTWTDPSTGTYTGKMVGKPLPLGMDGFWDFQHKNWLQCYNADGEAWCWYVDSYGAKSGYNVAGDMTDDVVPHSATQWTDQRFATYIPPGAWIIYPQGGTVLQAQKYAEIINRRPSLDYSRPCGKDRYAIDQKNVRCVESVSGNTLTTYTGELYNVIQTGDLVHVCSISEDLGGTIADGIYSASAADSTTVTLGDLAISASQVPNFYDDCQSGKIGKIRFPTARAICGRNYVTNITHPSGSNITCSFETVPHYLHHGDTVIFSGETTLQGVFQVVYIDHAKVALHATETYNTELVPKNTYAISPFAPNWQFSDTQVKGDFTTVEWKYDNREAPEIQRLIDENPAYGFTYTPVPDNLDAQSTMSCDFNYTGSLPRQAQVDNGFARNITEVKCVTSCLPLKTCCPSVVCISPNSESFCNGKTYPFPYIVSDETYGSNWQMIVKGEMDDPFWQPLHRDCTIDEDSGLGKTDPNVFVTEDDGQCSEDSEQLAGDGITIQTVKFYPHRPLVEARCTVPTGSPELPDGVYVGCATVAEMGVSPFSGSMCFPPNIIGEDPGHAPYPARPLTNWNLYLNELGCSCAKGRFATDYENNGVACNHITIVDPP